MESHLPIDDEKSKNLITKSLEDFSKQILNNELTLREVLSLEPSDFDNINILIKLFEKCNNNEKGSYSYLNDNITKKWWPCIFKMELLKYKKSNNYNNSNSNDDDIDIID